MMGSGKSTVGRSLAARLGVTFVDLDRRIERIEGRSIATLFEDEVTFRTLETRALQGLTREPGWAASGAVVATGGGAVLSETNWSLMEMSGVTVWLDVPSASLVDRLSAPSARRERPLLQGDDLGGTVRQLLDARAPRYRRASLVVDADAPVDVVCDRLLGSLGAGP